MILTHRLAVRIMHSINCRGQLIHAWSKERVTLRYSKLNYIITISDRNCIFGSASKHRENRIYGICFTFATSLLFARCEIRLRSHGFSLSGYNFFRFPFHSPFLPHSHTLLSLSLINLFTAKTTFLLAEFALTISHRSHAHFLHIILEQFTRISLTTAKSLHSFKDKTYPITKTNL